MCSRKNQPCSPETVCSGVVRRRSMTSGCTCVPSNFCLRVRGSLMVCVCTRLRHPTRSRIQRDCDNSEAPPVVPWPWSCRRRRPRQDQRVREAQAAARGTSARDACAAGESPRCNRVRHRCTHVQRRTGTVTVLCGVPWCRVVVCRAATRLTSVVPRAVCAQEGIPDSLLLAAAKSVTMHCVKVGCRATPVLARSTARNVTRVPAMRALLSPQLVQDGKVERVTSSDDGDAAEPVSWPVCGAVRRVCLPCCAMVRCRSCLGCAVVRCCAMVLTALTPCARTRPAVASSWTRVSALAAPRWSQVR